MHELSAALVASMNCQNTRFEVRSLRLLSVFNVKRQKEEDEAFNGKREEQDLDDEERERSELGEARKREMTLRSQLFNSGYVQFEKCYYTHHLPILQTQVHVKSDMLGLTCTRCIHFCDVTTINTVVVVVRVCSWSGEEQRLTPKV